MFGLNVVTRYEAAMALLDGHGLAAIDVAGCVAAAGDQPMRSGSVRGPRT